jgi:hypothetical protein
MGTTGDAQSVAPQDTRQAASSRGKWPHLIEGLGRLAGGSAVDGPLGLLAVERERLATDRHLATAEDARQTTAHA